MKSCKCLLIDTSLQNCNVIKKLKSIINWSFHDIILIQRIQIKQKRWEIKGGGRKCGKLKSVAQHEIKFEEQNELMNERITHILHLVPLQVTYLYTKIITTK